MDVHLESRLTTLWRLSSPGLCSTMRLRGSFSSWPQLLCRTFAVQVTSMNQKGPVWHISHRTPTPLSIPDDNSDPTWLAKALHAGILETLHAPSSISCSCAMLMDMPT